MGTNKNPKQENISTNKSGLFNSQKQTVYYYLQNNVATASMVAKATGIPHKNICRYKSQLQKEEKLWELYKMKCRATGHQAWYLTTNVENFQSFKSSNVQNRLDLWK